MTGCITLNYTPAPPASSALPVVLIHATEIIQVRPGETVTAPTIDGVKSWYLISDFAMEKVNQIQIDRTRLHNEN